VTGYFDKSGGQRKARRVITRRGHGTQW
jgi:hypothetical protein